ncbi:MAG: cobalamin biosynthesis protein CobQ [Pseudomonadota bacterium]
MSAPMVVGMNTPAHLVIAAAAFGAPNKPKQTWAAILGGFAPDFSLYFLTIWARFVQGHSFNHIFDNLYFSDAWQRIFSVDNSFFVWGALLGLGLWLKRAWLWAFAAGGLLHVALDFPLHHDDGRAHFWPLSDWVFESPVSYWDPSAYGNIVGPIEAALIVGLCIWMWTQYQSAVARALLGLAVFTQLAPYIMWTIMFSGSTDA